MLMRRMAVIVFAAAASFPITRFALAEDQQYTPPGDPAAVSEQDGKNLDAEGNPTYKLGADGTVDWYTYSGYRRYHSECHVCHGRMRWDRATRRSWPTR